MTRRWLPLALCSAVSFALGCDAALTTRSDDGGVRRDAAVADARIDGLDGGAWSDLDAGWDDAGSAGEEDAGIVDLGDAGTPSPMDAGSPPPPPLDAGPPPPTPTNPAFEVEMLFTTANIGRAYSTRAEVAAAIQRVRTFLGTRTGPRFVGWQEIGEGDPCGACEIEEIRARFTTAAGWTTRHPNGTRPDGASERVKVPVTSKQADPSGVRAVFASPGWAGVSPTRFVTVVHHPDRNLSMVNTHFIAGAWSCGSEVARRRDYWRQAWTTLRAQVAAEHDRGRNVIVTGDLNRARAASSCNPAWEPTNLHADSRIIGGEGIDYVFAVPARGWRFELSRRGDGTAERGDITLGIDGHRAHWVAGRFRHE